MIEEITKSLKASLYERATSSFLGSLVIFWIYFNWDLALVLLLDETNITDRISYVRENYVDSWSNYWGPLFYAGLFSIFYPYIAIFFYSISKHANSLKLWIRNKIEDIPTISVSEFKKLKEEIYKRDNEISVLISKKTIREDALLEERDALSEACAGLNSELEISKNGLAKYKVFKEDEIESAITDINRILDELEIHVTDNHTEGFYYFCKEYFEGIKPESMIRNCQSLHNDWLITVKNKVKIGAYTNIYDELETYIRSLIQIAEAVRHDIKYSIRNGMDISGTDVEINNKISSVKEDWDIVRRKINNIVDAWRRMVESDYSKEEVNVTGNYFPTLKPIEDGSIEREKGVSDK